MSVSPSDMLQALWHSQLCILMTCGGIQPLLITAPGGDKDGNLKKALENNKIKDPSLLPVSFCRHMMTLLGSCLLALTLQKARNSKGQRARRKETSSRGGMSAGVVGMELMY